VALCGGLLVAFDRLVVGQASQCGEQAIHIYRARKKVDGSASQCIDGALDRSPYRADDKGCVAIGNRGCIVGDNYIEMLALAQCSGLVTGRHGICRKTLELQSLAQIVSHTF
jgi:hypothetical protein